MDHLSWTGTPVPVLRRLVRGPLLRACRELRPERSRPGGCDRCGGRVFGRNPWRQGAVEVSCRVSLPIRGAAADLLGVLNLALGFSHPVGAGRFGDSRLFPPFKVQELSDQELSTVGQQLYDVLKRFHGYEVAMVGWDPESWIEVEALKSDYVADGSISRSRGWFCRTFLSSAGGHRDSFRSHLASRGCRTGVAPTSCARPLATSRPRLERLPGLRIRSVEGGSRG
jgi:hypothetical protein